MMWNAELRMAKLNIEFRILNYRKANQNIEFYKIKTIGLIRTILHSYLMRP